MPQRRSFAPNPMQPASVPSHGGAGRPPQPGAVPPQPLPPLNTGSPTASPGGDGQPPRPPLPMSIPLSPMQPTGGAPGGAPGGPTPQPMGGPAPPPGPPQMGQGTVNPGNVQSFLTPMQPQGAGAVMGPPPGPTADAAFDGGNMPDSGGGQQPDRFRLPHESATTSESLHAGGNGMGDEDGNEDGQIPMALLKMLQAMGQGGSGGSGSGSGGR